MNRLGKIVRGVVFALVAASIATELRKPSGQRTWHGQLFGKIPYDWRMPTMQRLRERWWNPREPRVFTDRTFGVGWDVNLYRLRALATGQS